MPSTATEPSEKPHVRSGFLNSLLFRVALRGTALFVLIALLSVVFLSCATRPPPKGSIDAVARLDALDRAWPGLSEPVRITWDEHLIPSINAQNDEDAAFAIGLVHAHLRLSQMELLKRVSQGRLAEMAGPLAAGIDEGIRAIDLDRAVDQIEAELPEPTARWLNRYVEGINAYREEIQPRPADARTLGFDPAEPWTVRDVLTFGRLASVDVNWGRWLAVSGIRGQFGAEDFTRRLWEFGNRGIPSFGPGSPHDLSTLTDIGRTGSNAIVVSGARSASGGALIASDPHLGLPQPNIWCVIAYRTPDRAAAGLTIPGLPFVLVGRNEQIGWSGTNMQASSTALYQLPQGWAEQAARTESIAVRFWFDRERTIRESEHGPVITDAKLLTRFGAGDIAMRWRGHDPSDESSAFLNASDATDWNQFREAFSTYATGGQNILYADRDGNIGQLMAIEAVPAAAAASRAGVVDPADPRFIWTRGIPSNELPAAYNPGDGFIVSANNTPTPTAPALVPQGNANDRVARMQDLLREDRVYTLDDPATIHQDTYSIASHRLAAMIVANANTDQLSPDAQALLDDIEAWDGRYNTNSVGAAAYQRVLSELIPVLYEDRYAQSIQRTMRSAPYVHDLVTEDVESLESPDLLLSAIENASIGYQPQTWGDVHRLRLAHPLGLLPILGRPYVFEDAPHAGSTTTVYKGAHAVSGATHQTTFGACSRLLCDMGTLDDNRVVLLGGQDGWMGSDRLLDQVPIWQRGGYIPLPLTTEAQEARAVRASTLTPQ